MISSSMAQVSAGRNILRAALRNSIDRIALQQLAIAQQRCSSDRAGVASFPGAQHWQVRPSLFGHSRTSLTWSRSRQAAGPLAPPTQRTASAPAGAPAAAATNAGRLAGNAKNPGATTYSSHRSGMRPGGDCSRCPDCPGRARTRQERLRRRLRRSSTLD
jgi:hypothetical protein